MMDMIFILIVLMAVYVFTYPKYHADQVMAAFFGVVYVCRDAFLYLSHPES